MIKESTWCLGCGKECAVYIEDYGIGNYEYGGAHGFDTEKCEVSSCCEAEFVDYDPMVPACDVCWANGLRGMDCGVPVIRILADTSEGHEYVHFCADCFNDLGLGDVATAEPQYFIRQDESILNALKPYNRLRCAGNRQNSGEAQPKMNTAEREES